GGTGPLSAAGPPGTRACTRWFAARARRVPAASAKTSVSIRSRVRRRRVSGSLRNRLCAATPAATRGWATWRSSARPPPSSTAASRCTRHVMLSAVKRPRERSPARRPCARRRRATSAGASPGVARCRVTNGDCTPRERLRRKVATSTQGGNVKSAICLDPLPTALYGSRMKGRLGHRIGFAVWAFACLLGLGTCGSVLAAPRPSLSPGIVEATTIRRALRTRHHRIVVSLDLRNRDALEAFLVALQDPGSPQYQHFL